MNTGGGTNSLSLNDTETNNLNTNKNNLVVEDSNYLNFDISKYLK